MDKATNREVVSQNDAGSGATQNDSSKLHQEAVAEAYGPKTSQSGGIAHEGMLFAEGLITGSVFKAVNGAAELTDHVFGTHLGKPLQFSNQNEVDNSAAGKIGENAGMVLNPSSALLGTQEGMLFTEGLVSGAAFNAINGATQLSNHAFGTNIGTLQLDNQKEVDGSWAGKIGEMTGTTADFVGLTMATGGAASAAGFTGLAGYMAGGIAAGAVDGAVFTPSSNDSFWTGRLRHGLLGAGFAVATVAGGAALKEVAYSVGGSIAKAAETEGAETGTKLLSNLENMTDSQFSTALASTAKSAGSDIPDYYAMRYLSDPAEIERFANVYAKSRPDVALYNIESALRVKAVAPGTESIWRNASTRSGRGDKFRQVSG